MESGTLYVLVVGFPKLHLPSDNIIQFIVFVDLGPHSAVTFKKLFVSRYVEGNTIYRGCQLYLLSLMLIFCEE